MISFVVRDGRHFMVHLKIKRTGVLVVLLPTALSVHYICCNIKIHCGEKSNKCNQCDYAV